MQVKLLPRFILFSIVASILLSANAQTVTTTAGEDSSSSSSSFMPPASSTCLAANFVTGGDFLDCCPAPDANDGICTLIWCIRPDLTIRDSCDCGQVETACDQLAMFTSMVDGLYEACTAMSGCCETGVTSNSDFASCTEDAIAMSNITIPDIASLVPGGVPNLDDAVTTSTATTTAAVTSTSPAVETTATPKTEEATTPAATGAEKGTSGANRLDFGIHGVHVVFIGISSSIVALLFV